MPRKDSKQKGQLREMMTKIPKSIRKGLFLTARHKHGNAVIPDERGHEDQQNINGQLMEWHKRISLMASYFKNDSTEVR